MNQALMAVAQALENQTNFVGRIAADVAALKNVVCALDSRAEPMFAEQVAIIHDRLQQERESRHREFEMLRQLISQLPKPKPN
jgi:hypothetical protein